MPTARSSEVKLADGKIWKNMTIPEKAKVAETLDEYRAAHKYNLTDENLRAFNAEVPIFVQWDDHEVTNNWSPSKELPAVYKVRDISLLAARAGRAFHEMYPMRESIAEPGRVYRPIPYGPHLDVFVLDERSYRGPNGPNLETAYGPASYFLGPDADRLAQARPPQFPRDLEGDRLRHADGPGRRTRRQDPFEAVANGDGPPRGRELEIADLLRFIKTDRSATSCGSPPTCTTRPRITTIPTRRSSTDFEPFWEFVAGPLHAGTFGPNALDNTFGPEVRFVKAPGKDSQNLPPSAGMQFFGHVKIDGASGQMTVTLRDRADVALWSTTLDPKPG